MRARGSAHQGLVHQGCPLGRRLRRAGGDGDPLPQGGCTPPPPSVVPIRRHDPSRAHLLPRVTLAPLASQLPRANLAPLASHVCLHTLSRTLAALSPSSLSTLIDRRSADSRRCRERLQAPRRRRAALRRRHRHRARHLLARGPLRHGARMLMRFDPPPSCTRHSGANAGSYNNECHPDKQTRHPHAGRTTRSSSGSARSSPPYSTSTSPRAPPRGQSGRRSGATATAHHREGVALEPSPTKPTEPRLGTERAWLWIQIPHQSQPHRCRRDLTTIQAPRRASSSRR